MRVEKTDEYRDWIDGTRLLLLLIGGDKSTQRKDIARAIQLARNFME